MLIKTSKTKEPKKISGEFKDKLVSRPNNRKYEENYDRIFRKEDK